MRRSESAMASASVCSRERAIRCTITSVSLVVWKIEPGCSSCARISSALMMLPLCASAILPLLHSTMMGCAFSSAESPVVE